MVECGYRASLFEYLLRTLIETKSLALLCYAHKAEVNDETKHECINIHVRLNAVGCIKIRGDAGRVFENTNGQIIVKRTFSSCSSSFSIAHEC